jgi:uncharacterized protein (DUF1778 family)
MWKGKPMTAKTERIEMRAEPEVSARIAEAARAAGTSVSAFVLAAAASAADRILARSDQTLMPADQFDALIESLDVPDAAPRLTQLAKQPRRFTRS